MKKQTLVIHPEDPSTDFLIDIYRDRGFTEIRQDFHPQKLEELILNHQRILNDYGKLSTEVAQYNRERLCFRGMDGRTIATDVPSTPELSSLLKLLFV